MVDVSKTPEITSSIIDRNHGGLPRWERFSSIQHEGIAIKWGVWKLRLSTFSCIFQHYQSCCILDTFHRRIHSGLECALSRPEHTCRSCFETNRTSKENSQIPVQPLLFVHYPKHMEQLVEEASAEQFQKIFRVHIDSTLGEIIPDSPTLCDASRTVCQLEEALKFHLSFDQIPSLFS